MRIRRSVMFSVLPLAAMLAAAGYSTIPLAGPEPFSQGVIVTKVSLPGNPYDKMLSRIDPSKGNVQAQVQQLAASLTPAEQRQFQAEAQAMSPAMTMGALMLPRKGTIYCRGQEVRVNTDGLTYHLENYFNGAKNAGLVLLKSHTAAEQVAYTYDAASVKKTWQSIVVVDTDYTIQPTTETVLVAGYPSQKTTYTLKPGAAAANANEQKPVALDVWTAPQLPQVLNFAHPVYVKQKNGISKLTVYFDQARKQQLVYEVASVQAKPVTPEDLQVKTTSPVLDYAKDEMQIGMKLLAIMLGGRPSATDE
ncbi:hypothetical protein [Hymenobacter sp. DG01]|uniref:hypothetical protein n=1 Tax=Hymenobacter sp. DG01 TaxID=2584940 RepID=UPI00111DA0A0|nr:hypothetical protein [Hymenobacter sp. DG01]